MNNIIKTLRKQYWAGVFVICLRYLIGSGFVFASMVKIQGERFTILSPETRIGHFFETLYQTGMYWQFLGWAQLIAALLLMTQRFAVLGALMFFPIILNIFIITISLEFAGTPFVTGLMLLATAFLLLWDYEKFMPLFQPSADENNDLLWVVMGVLLFGAAISMKWLTSLAAVLTVLIAILVIMFGIVALQFFRAKHLLSKKKELQKD